MDESLKIQDQIELVAIDNLTPNPEQPRKHFDDNVIAELASSLKELGFINPITVREGENGTRIIIAGEQRYRAAKLAGITMVPCIVKSNDNTAEISLAENMMRQNLTAVEEAEALLKLMLQGVSQKMIAKKFGKAQSTISELIAIANMPEYIKSQCRSNHEYARRELKKIATAPADKQMVMFESYKKKIASTVRTPHKSERPASASLKTAVKLLSNRIDTFDQVDSVVDQNEITTELQLVRDKIDALLASFRRVEA